MVHCIAEVFLLEAYITIYFTIKTYFFMSVGWLDG